MHPPALQGLQAVRLLHARWPALLLLGSLAVGSAPVVDFYRYAFVYHVPRAILAAALALLAAVSFGVGLLLDTISRYHQETIEQWKRSLRGVAPWTAASKRPTCST